MANAPFSVKLECHTITRFSFSKTCEGVRHPKFARVSLPGETFISDGCASRLHLFSMSCMGSIRMLLLPEPEVDLIAHRTHTVVCCDSFGEMLPVDFPNASERSINTLSLMLRQGMGCKKKFLRSRVIRRNWHSDCFQLPSQYSCSRRSCKYGWVMLNFSDQSVFVQIIQFVLLIFQLSY